MHLIELYGPNIKECIENFCINIQTDHHPDVPHLLYTDAIARQKKLFLELMLTFDPQELEAKTEEMLAYTIEHEIPYMFVYGELITVTRNLLGNLIEQHAYDDLKALNRHFSKHEQRITTLYLHKFLNQLLMKYTQRISHIAELDDKKLMIHYEDHLQWMVQLIHYIQPNHTKLCPELRHTHCDFGKWLHTTTLTYLISTSHFKMIEDLHVNLHDLAENLIKYSQTPKRQSSTLIHLIQRIDYVSLEIGNEIAVLNEIEYSAKDPLTDLLSRRLLSTILTKQLQISQATEQPLSLIMCDLDYFKTINDTYGHVAGDAVLKSFATLLRDTFRKSDYLFRYGGEEFVVILPVTDETTARTLAESLRTAARTVEVPTLSGPIRYTLSIGVISIRIPPGELVCVDTIQKYLSNVDAKLYLAKENGRDRVE